MILSRFNVVHRHVGDSRDSRRMNERRFDRKWMNRRIDLMTRYTATSLKDQTDKGFDWYVFVQEGTPDTKLDEIEELGATVVEATRDDVDAAQDLVRSQRYHGWVATVNLDTDDAVSRDFVGTVRSYARERNERFAFLRGVRHREVEGVDPWSVSWKSETNPFQVVTEQSKDALTVFNEIHGKTARLIDTPRPMWLMVLHGDNIDNRRLERTSRDENLFQGLPQYFSIMAKHNYGRNVNRRSF
ncbi:MAG: putative rhamnosyl transferase [Nitrososphaera sp.]|nr:putative rhamnosyl transferase [Nitrososphaera sp.]